MSEPAQFTRPVVCTGSGFKPDTAGWNRCEKTKKGIPGELPPDGYLAIRGNSVDLKNALSDVYPNTATFIIILLI